jgi:hypothetical protein
LGFLLQTYKKDWVSWRDFLGYGEGKLPVGTFLSFEEAREVARTQQFSSVEEVRSHPFDSTGRHIRERGLGVVA